MNEENNVDQVHNATNDDEIPKLFERCGFLMKIPILSRPESQEIMSQLQSWIQTLPNQTLSGNVRFKPHLFLPFISPIVHHPKIIQMVSKVLNTSNILLWSSDFNIKQPKSDDYFPLHQDSTYTGLAPAHLGVTVWLAISDPVDETNGCMTFIEGSHKFGQLDHCEENDNTQKNANMLSRKQYIPNQNIPFSSTKNESHPPKKIATLRGGEASIHHFHLIHQSGPNRANQPRVGLAMRYIAASVKQMGDIREMVTLINGHTEHDGFDLEPILCHRFHETHTQNDWNEKLEIGKKAHDEAMKRETMNYFNGSQHLEYS